MWLDGTEGSEQRELGLCWECLHFRSLAGKGFMRIFHGLDVVLWKGLVVFLERILSHRLSAEERWPQPERFKHTKMSRIWGGFHYVKGTMGKIMPPPQNNTGLPQEKESAFETCWDFDPYPWSIVETKEQGRGVSGEMSSSMDLPHLTLSSPYLITCHSLVNTNKGGEFGQLMRDGWGHNRRTAFADQDGRKSPSWETLFEWVYVGTHCHSPNIFKKIKDVASTKNIKQQMGCLKPE